MTPPTAKADQTRARILEAAMQLFREKGYEQTTMRAVADAAGVSTGNAYYYFKSKDEMIQAFYARTHTEHLAAVGAILEQGGTLEQRLLGVMRAKLDTIAPYHRFAGVLFRTAADPGSPLNPFSEESLPVRSESTDVFARVLKGSRTKLPEDLAAELPQLLWTYHMGVILFWIHDTSKGHARSYRLMEGTVGLVVKLIKLARNPLLAPVRKASLKLLREIRGDDDRPPAAA